MNAIRPVAVLAGMRTPFRKSFSSHPNHSAVDLGEVALEATLKQAALKPSDVDEVVFGNVGSPPDTPNLARVIALKAGVPDDRIAHTVHRNCGSGMEAILGGWQAIAHRDSNLVIAGGTESMSAIPMFLSGEAQARWMRLARAKTMGQRIQAALAFRPRHFRPLSGLQLGLTDPICGLSMGQTAERLASEFGISRLVQDEFALRSHQKAEAAQKRCFLSGEIGPLGTGEPKPISKDNGIRSGQTIEALSKLRPVFEKDGTVTAGNSSQLTDGAVAMALCDPNSVSQYCERPLGYITAYAIAGCAPDRMGLGPVHATAKLLEATGLSLADFDLIEINEAFAAQVLACEKAYASDQFATRSLNRKHAIGELAMDKVNINGGAIALGHPVGATGARLVLTLLRALRAGGLHRGLATLCIGGGQGMAFVVETELEAGVPH